MLDINRCKLASHILGIPTSRREALRIIPDTVRHSIQSDRAGSDENRDDGILH